MGAQIKRRALRAEDLRVDAKRLMHRVPHAHAVEEVAHRAARREHDIASLIAPANIMSQRALAQGADAPPHDLRQIGMIEGDQRYATALCDPCCAPRRTERVTR